jgi:hypothetical protein
MKQNKEHLAKLILIQVESLNEAKKEGSYLNLDGIKTLEHEIARDAKQLAELIQNENNQVA